MIGFVLKFFLFFSDCTFLLLYITQNMQQLQDSRTDAEKKEDEFLSEPILRLSSIGLDADTDSKKEPEKTRVQVVCKACKTEFPPMFDFGDDDDDRTSHNQASGCAAWLQMSRIKPSFMHVAGAYGSCFDTMSDRSGWMVLEEKKSDEMQLGGPYCDECIKRWIKEGRVNRTDMSPVCSGECKQPLGSYVEYQQHIPISLRRHEHGGQSSLRISDEIPIYYAAHTIYQIEEKDLEMYNAHWKENARNNLSTNLWICYDCFAKKAKIPVLGAVCAFCQTKYRVDSIDTSYGVNCCHHLSLSGCTSLWGKSKWKRTGEWYGDLHYSDELQIKEVKKLCERSRPVCDDCIGKLIEEGKLVFTGRMPVDAPSTADDDT